MTLAAAGLCIALAIGLPHVVPLERLSPRAAATVWLSALLLRALCALTAAVAVEVVVPTLGVMAPLARVCIHTPVRELTAHAAGDLVLALPALALAVSVTAALLGLWRAALRVRRLVRDGVGPGPQGSIVIADREPLLAAAGLHHPRIVVSAGALLALDDAELAAALAHERGHIARGHRYVLLTGHLARSLACCLPGTRAALRELVFELERDADHYALARRHHPAVLASAICKAATAALQPPALMIGGGGVARRVRLLLAGENATLPRLHLAPLILAPMLAGLVLAGAIALPFVAHAAYHTRHDATAAAVCGPSRQPPR
jgi:Zn-dependent protease with chaperone function